MHLLTRLGEIWQGADYPFLIDQGEQLRFSEVARDFGLDFSLIRAGEVVAIVGDFNPISISTLLRLIDRGAIVVPLTAETRSEHEYFFESALVDVVIEGSKMQRRNHDGRHKLVDELRQKGHAGLVLFSTGTTGRPKAILHDLTLFLERFETPRPTLRTVSFLLFDHIGGLNTLLHTLFNRGVVIAPGSRAVEQVLETCRKFDVEVLPTTPTFLRIMLMSGMVPAAVPASLKIITYGTERMDQPTLDELCRLLPSVDFRQTFGMSELGIVRVKSRARGSLYMKIGGEGVEAKVVENVLHIRSRSRMLGYLNASSPFDDEGWYCTNDIVEVDGDFIRVTGRTTEVINVGGLKFMASDVERVALECPNVALVKVSARPNPITGQHVELTVQPQDGYEITNDQVLTFLRGRLQAHMMPKRVRIEPVSVGHRFKRA